MPNHTCIHQVSCFRGGCIMLICSLLFQNIQHIIGASLISIKHLGHTWVRQQVRSGSRSVATAGKPKPIEELEDAASKSAPPAEATRRTLSKGIYIYPFIFRSGPVPNARAMTGVVLSHSLQGWSGRHRFTDQWHRWSAWQFTDWHGGSGRHGLTTI